MKPAHRILLEWSLVCSTVCGLVLACALQGWLWRFDLQLHDISLAHAPAAPDPGIVIVAIDEASLAELGRWPWPRQTHAALLDRLHAAGSKGVAMDIIFSEATRDDALLASAIRRHGKVVLPVLQAESQERIIGESLPAPLLREAAAALGHIHMEFDPDGIARSVYLYEGWEAARHPQLALAVLQLEQRPALPAEEVTGPGWRRAIWLRIPFAGPPGSYARLSYADVLAGRVPDDLLRDKLILVGATAQGLTDSVPVPTSALSRPMPGVEVHANVLAALRSGKAIQLGSPWLNAGFGVLISLGMMGLLGRSSARSGLLWTLGVMAAVVLGSGLCLLHAGFWLGPASALLGCLLAYPLWSWRRLEATQRYVDTELQALHQSPAITVPGGLDPLQHRLALLRAAASLSREAQALAESVIAHLPVGVIALHADGRLRLSNQTACSLLGVGTPEALPAALKSLPWPGTVQTPAGLPLPPDEACELELRTRADRPLLLRLAALGDGGLVLGLADLSHVEAAQQAREDTLRFVTHDLRAPLASVISLIDVAPPEVELLPAIRKIADNALGLIDALFRLSRAEAADPESFETVDLHAVMQDAVELCWGQARSAGVEICIHPFMADEALTHGNHELLHRAVGNLLSNAIKYGGKGKVELSLSASGHEWQIAVRDHGPGIPEKDRLRLFQRFARLPDAIRRGLPGSGLGLLMVRTVAERHGGRVEASFPDDGGCCFSLWLARSQA